MTFDRSALATQANNLSKRAAAPYLESDSDREQVTAWLQWCDPNGCHTDDLAIAEGCEPYTLDEAWHALANMLADD